MTHTMRPPSLLAVCWLVSACSDPAAPQASRPTPEVELDKPENVALAATPQLTSAAPALHTVAAAPKAAPGLELVHATEPPSMADKPVENSAEGEPGNFDRPVSAGEVKIDRFVLATSVEHREPVGETDHFSVDTPQIFAFVQFANPERPPFALRVHWEKVGEPASPYGFKLNVPTAARYRTWSWTKIKREPGEYRAVLRTLTGEEVASRSFHIEEKGEP